MNTNDLSIPTAPRYADAVPILNPSRCHCARCIHQTPTSSPILDWHRLGRTAQAVTTATAAGILQCVGAVAAAVPHVAAFYATAMAVRAATTFVSGDGLLLDLIRLEPLPNSRACSLAMLSAATYGVDVISRRRARRGLSTALIDTLSRAMRMAVVIATASCAVGSIVARSTDFCRFVQLPASGSHLKAYKEGLLDGVALGATVAIVAVGGTILFQSSSAIVTRLRRALARVIDTEPDSAETQHTVEPACRTCPDGLETPPLSDVARAD
ncbi:hypothetical protein TW95_gp0933 [Pandoravirus inopinatum]|uniref:Uncharacterized protein n=1 Tax=Pandoravirus inopinatum TaxID=1605721 RepID=A0A0B5JDC5_9VIRU|nr:hypothetical protein TW95_gp0933 [Pandoravirus inopinatum]AJF97667.1 hypothetical protein [Pandoravirus inopinatum]